MSVWRIIFVNIVIGILVGTLMLAMNIHFPEPLWWILSIPLIMILQYFDRNYIYPLDRKNDPPDSNHHES